MSDLVTNNEIFRTLDIALCAQSFKPGAAHIFHWSIFLTNGPKSTEPYLVKIYVINNAIKYFISNKTIIM